MRLLPEWHIAGAAALPETPGKMPHHETRKVSHMAFEEIKAQITMLISQINNQPEDIHELYEQLHQKLNELRATGQALPEDLVRLEAKILKQFPKR